MKTRIVVVLGVVVSSMAVALSGSAATLPSLPPAPGLPSGTVPTLPGLPPAPGLPSGTVPTLPGLPPAPGLPSGTVPTRPTSCPPLPSDPNTGTGTGTVTGTFPWPTPPTGTDPEDYASYDHTPAQSPPLRPSNWQIHGSDWKLTSARSSEPSIDLNPQELCGVEGNSVDTAWQVTTGRPTTIIAIVDSGVEWCDPGLVNKFYLNRAALPLPENAEGLTKPQLEARGVKFADADPYDLNNSGVFNVQQYAQDPRIQRPYFCAHPDFGAKFPAREMISPEDLIRAFGHDHRQGPRGFTEAISGWNFVDNSNDPYDDVHYDHGTGEAEDAVGAANDLTQQVGGCPNCMVLPIRGGDSFLTYGNTYAQGIAFAVDSGASVIRVTSSVDITETARQAEEYAFAHGVPIVNGAADEEAEHHLPGETGLHSIVVNSVIGPNAAREEPLYNPPSYLYLNGCTNYGGNIAVSVESASCSSEASGKATGIVGLAEAAAQDALERGVLKPYPGLRTVAGKPVALSANEMRQLVTMSADDIDFQTAAPPFGPPDNYAVASPPGTTRFHTQPGFDMYTGYGRINAARIVDWISHGQIPPEAYMTSPEWFQTLSPAQTLTVRGTVAAVRASSFRYQVQVGVGVQPEPTAWHTVAIGSGSGRLTGVLARIPLSTVAALFPRGTDFASGPTGLNGHPKPDKFTFTVRVVVQDNGGMIGMSRRTEFLHADPTLLAGFPRHFSGSLIAPPTLAPIAPGHRNALLVATTDGEIHALLPDGMELAGWPVKTDILSYHRAEPAFAGGALTAPHGTIMGGVAVGDLFGRSDPGSLDVVAADLTGRVYAWNSHGRLLPGFPVRTSSRYSGPGVRDPNNRVLRGIFAAPALADLQGNGRLDIVAAAMDRHVYAWQPDGRPVPGWPVLVVDPSEVQSVDPVTDKVTFKPDSGVTIGSKLMDTPAIGALSGKGAPDVVVGSNEEYLGALDASVTNPLNAGLGLLPILQASNSRVYAIAPNGALRPAGPGAANPAGYPNPGAFLPGWPVSVGMFKAGVVPDVADGVVNSPALADLDGKGGLETGVVGALGPGYVLNPDGSSYLGTGPDGKPRVLSLQPTGLLSNSLGGFPTVPGFGGAIFAPLGRLAPETSMVAPAASLEKLLDIALPGDQRPHDSQVDAWSTRTGHLLTGFPQVVNELEFLVQPLAADVGGAGAGPYVVVGSSLYDIRAVNGAGQEAPGFPKFTGGWLVNSPSFGPYGSLNDQVLAAGTLGGDLFVWRTSTPACAASGPWPREHHDLFNTGDLDQRGTPVATCATR